MNLSILEILILSALGGYLIMMLPSVRDWVTKKLNGDNDGVE